MAAFLEVMKQPVECEGVVEGLDGIGEAPVEALLPQVGDDNEMFSAKLPGHADQIVIVFRPTVGDDHH